MLRASSLRLSTSRIIGSLLFALVLAACGGPSDADVQHEFDRVVAQANSCSRDEQCIVISPGCPLGCWVAINGTMSDVVMNVQNRATELIEDYENGGRSCSYECTAKPGARCLHSRCALGQPVQSTGTNTGDAGTTPP